MTELDKKVNGQVKCRTKKLENGTGVSGQEFEYEKGFPWNRIKERAMQNYSNDDYVIVSLFLFFISNQVDLTDEEFEIIEKYCLRDSKEKVPM